MCNKYQLDHLGRSATRRQFYRPTTRLGLEAHEKPGGLNRSVQHHLMNDFLKVVFYDTRKTGQAFHGAAG
jgi:hypothetical protein